MTTTPQTDWEYEFGEKFSQEKIGIDFTTYCQLWSFIEKLLSKARNETLDEAKKIIKTWHIKKGGFSEIEYRIEQLKFK